MQKIRLFVMVLFAVLQASQAQALDFIKTPEHEFTETAPIIITAYQTYAGATKLAAVEIMNDSSTPVDVRDWEMWVTTKDLQSHRVDSASDYSGVLLPGEHVVYSADKGATYQLIYGGALPITIIEMRYNKPDKNYKVMVGVKDAADQAQFRLYTASGASYSSAAQPFATVPIRAFYDDGLYKAPPLPLGLEITEIYPYASDCAPSDISTLCGDYVKLANTSENEVILDGIVLRTDSNGLSRESSNTITLSGTLAAHTVLAVTHTNSGGALTLTNSGGYVWLEDEWGMARYDETLRQYAAAGSAEQGYAYVAGSDGRWQWTTTPQPFGANSVISPVYEVAECPVGKYRNPDTGRCRTIEEAVNALAACEEGYERSPMTNRCRKAVTVAAATLTPCLEGQERNPATNRCRSIASAVAELMPCDEGYERNPATNRCRKATSGSVPDAAFPVAPFKKADADITGWLAFGAVLILALGYGAWEWRHELAGGVRWLTQRLRRAK